jgi:hypothetical protein
MKDLTIQSTTTLCVVVSGSLEPVLYPSLEKRIMELAKDEENKKSKVYKILLDIYRQNVDCPFILLGDSGLDAILLIQKIKKIASLVQPIKSVKSQPDLILLDSDVKIDFANNSDLIKSMRAFFIYDVFPEKVEIKQVAPKEVKTDTEAPKEVKTNAEAPKGQDGKIQKLLGGLGYSSERLIPCFPQVKNSEGETRNLSPFIAGLILKTDAKWDHGYSDSFSNREIKGIASVTDPIDFSFGEKCDADDLRNANITTVINVNGFRSWGGNTYCDDKYWRSMQRLRIFDKVIDATISGLFDAIDKRADILSSAKHKLEQLLLSLQGFGVLLGNEIYWDKEKNTKENLLNGRFYLCVSMQNTPLVERLEITFSPTDKYQDVMLEIIK